MTTNLDRLRADLKKLINMSLTLEISFGIVTHGIDAVLDQMKELGWKKEDIEKLPRFNVAYEAWYSEALVTIRQLLPDRLTDFKEHYETPKNRKELNYTTYRIQDALKGTQSKNPLGQIVVDDKAATPHLRQQIAILKAAEKRFESSLFEIRQLVQSDLFDEELGAARELAKHKFLRASGAICGVVLERHLKQVCDDHKVAISKRNPGIGDLNELLRSAGVTDVPQWRHISMLADIRNICDHSKAVEPTSQQIADLLDGTDKVLRTIS